MDGPHVRWQGVPVTPTPGLVSSASCALPDGESGSQEWYSLETEAVVIDKLHSSRTAPRERMTSR
jgi:hypothetical protein